VEDMAALAMQNATIAANEIKDFIATLAGLPPSPVKNHIAQLINQVFTLATTNTEVRERNSALMIEGRYLVKNKIHSDKELALMQQTVKDLEDSAPTCTYGDLQSKIMELVKRLANRMPTDREQEIQQPKDTQE
jgi:hypothetical protein